MQTIKIRNLDSTEDNTVTDNSYLALALNENDVKRKSEDPNDLNPRITVKTTISQLKKAILPTIGDSPPVSENEEGGIDVGIGDVILDENGDALVPQPPVVIKQGGKDQIKITDDGISLKENVIIDKTLSVTGPTTFNNTTTFNRDVFFNELTSDPSPTEGKIYRKSDGLYFNGSKLLTEGQGGKWVDGDSSGDIVYNGGNVGIGTTSPDAPLTVKGASLGSNAGARETLAQIQGSRHRLLFNEVRHESATAGVNWDGVTYKLQKKVDATEMQSINFVHNSGAGANDNHIDLYVGGHTSTDPIFSCLLYTSPSPRD